MDSRLKDILAIHGKLVTHRRNYEPMWQEIAERLMPDAAVFTNTPQPGGKRTQKMFDATAALALTRYGAAMESMLTPRTQRWHGLRHRDKRLSEKQNIKEYFDVVTDVLFSARYAPEANFADQAHQCYMSLGAYGNGPMFIDDMLGRGIRYRSLHLSELYFCENFAGIIDMVHRPFKYSARQAYQRFGEELPEKVRKLVGGKDEMQEFKFLHCVKPNEDYKPGRLGQNALKFSSYYICLDEEKMVRAGNGYRTFPYAIGRNMTMPGEVYGRGPASLVLPDIKQLNEFEKIMLRQGHMAIDPAILLSEDGNLTGFNHQPGALMWGGLDEDGNELAKPFRTEAKLAVGFDMMEQKRKLINDAFLVTLFQILVDNPQMTATEAMLRAQEKGQLLAPTMGRQQSEFLGRIIPREIEILTMAGELPPPPPELVEAGFDGLTMDGIDVEYVSPLNRAQKAEEGVAIARTIELAGSIAQYDPEAPRILKGSEMLREVAEINGMRSKLLYSPEELAAQKQQAAEAEQLNQLLAAAPVAGKAAKDFAQAQALAGAGGNAALAPVTLPQ